MLAALRDATSPFTASRIRTSESGLSLVEESSPQPHGANPIAAPGSPMSASFRERATGNSGMDLAMTPSMQTTHDLRNVSVEVERSGPGMFRLTATPDCAGSYYLRAAVGTLAADAPFLQVRRHCCGSCPWRHRIPMDHLCNICRSSCCWWGVAVLCGPF